MKKTVTTVSFGLYQAGTEQWIRSRHSAANISKTLRHPDDKQTLV